MAYSAINPLLKGTERNLDHVWHAIFKTGEFEVLDALGLFRADDKTILDHTATNPGWSKYRACEATSAHWYSLEQIERYAGALIDRDLEFRKRHPRSTREKTTVRDFIAQFRGMSATDKQKQVLRELRASHMSLYQFFGSETEVNHQRMGKLLGLLQEHTRPVCAQLLGVIGEEHLRQLLVDAGGEHRFIGVKSWAPPTTSNKG